MECIWVLSVVCICPRPVHAVDGLRKRAPGRNRLAQRPSPRCRRRRRPAVRCCQSPSHRTCATCMAVQIPQHAGHSREHKKRHCGLQTVVYVCRALIFVTTVHSIWIRRSSANLRARSSAALPRLESYSFFTDGMPAAEYQSRMKQNAGFRCDCIWSQPAQTQLYWQQGNQSIATLCWCQRENSNLPHFGSLPGL